MKARSLRLALVFFGIAAMGAGLVHAESGNSYDSESVLQRGRNRHNSPAYALTDGRRIVSSPGTVVNNTYWDLQQLGSTGRQIDHRNGTIAVAFVHQATPVLTPGRTVLWNQLNVVGSPVNTGLANGDSLRILPLGPPVSPTGEDIAIGTNQKFNAGVRFLPNGRNVVFFHAGSALQSHAAAIEFVAGSGFFNTAVAPQPSGYQAENTIVLWPHGSVSICGTDTILHVVADASGARLGEVWYWRGTVSGGSSVTWDPPVFFDTAAFWTAVVEAQGPHVAVVHTVPRRDQGGLPLWFDAFLVLRTSSDCGVTWDPPVVIPDHPDRPDERPFADADILIDPDGTVHVVWSTMNAAGSVLRPSSMNHWNSDRGTTRQIGFSDWPVMATDGGCSETTGLFPGLSFGTMPFGRPSISVKPAGAGPGAGIANELLYVVWSQAGPVDGLGVGDCSALDSSGTPGGFVNLELYCSVSSDDGFTWDRPQNITGTVTPNCLPGDCHSENYPSTATLADSGLYIAYLDDAHPGSIAHVEGVWSLNSFRVLAMATREPVIAPLINVGPQLDFAELVLDTIGNTILDFDIRNSGNTGLSYQMTVTTDGGGVGQVTVNGGSSYSGFLPIDGAETVTVSLTGAGLPNPSEFNWRIEITSNDPDNDPGQGGSPIDINLNVFVANPWFTCSEDSINTGSINLTVSSCLELGNQGAGGGLRSLASEREWLWDGSPFVAWQDAGLQKRVYRDARWSTSAQKSRAANQAFRAQSGVLVVADTTLIQGGDTTIVGLATGTASSTDSLFRVDWEVVGPKSPELRDGIVMEYTVWNVSGMTQSGIHAGAVVDFNVDSLAHRNAAIGNIELHYIGLQGGTGDTAGGFIAAPNFAALFAIPRDPMCERAPAGSQAFSHDGYTAGDGSYITDSLYDVITRTTAWNGAVLPSDSIGDLSVILISTADTSLEPGDSLHFALGMAVSDQSIEDLETKIVALQAFVNPACDACPVLATGDSNADGVLTSADIIGLVNFVFKGGTPPQPCQAAGDANCDGVITSSDIIYMVGHVFKGGAPPCDVCNLIPGTWTCQ